MYVYTAKDYKVLQFSCEALFGLLLFVCFGSRPFIVRAAINPRLALVFGKQSLELFSTRLDKWHQNVC